SIVPTEPDAKDLVVKIGERNSTEPYTASLFNVSAMSYGALSPAAVQALNKAAKKGGFYHNTGEGGLSPHHLQGGDLVWQIGTGYFSCRNPETGKFDENAFKERARNPNVKMIEIKLSQGAKPGKGGILPGAKVSEEIAAIRLVKPWRDVHSP